MYLHCHSCDWSQDDFYTKGYNPLIRMRDSIRWTIRPRILKLDHYEPRNMAKSVWTPIFYKGGEVFSWNWLVVELERDIRSFLHMKWRTKEIWDKVKHKATCPNCGARNFDID